MTNEELHIASMAKLRNKILPALQDVGLGIVISSEVVLPFKGGAISRPRMGGLRYAVANSKAYFIEIHHTDADLFTIYTMPKKGKPHQINGMALARFENLPKAIREILSTRKKKPKK